MNRRLLNLLGILLLPYLVGFLINIWGSIDGDTRASHWQASEIIQRGWVEQPLANIIDSGRWQVSENLLDGDEEQKDALVARVVAVVLSESTYALLEVNDEQASGKEILKVQVGEPFRDWEIQSIGAAEVVLHRENETKKLSLFEEEDYE